MKSKKYIICIILITLSIFFSNNILANSSSKNFIDIESKYAVVIDFETGRVLYEKNAYDKSPMASLTKVMTSILLCEYCNMDELIEIPAAATFIGGSEVGLKKGDKVSAEDLLYSMLLPSGNDAAYTVGLHLGGTIDNFAQMMTKKAKEIGAYNTSFANPHGLDNENHYSTAYDMAIITRYALKNKYINEAVKTKQKTVNLGSFSKTLTNTNRLLKNYSEIDGVKTGFTNGANRCLIASQTVDGNRYICVVLGAQTTDFRFNNAKTLLDECFKRYKTQDISDILNFYINVPVEKGNITSYERKISDTLKLPLTDLEYEKIYVKQDILENIVPPMNMGTSIGKISVFIDDEKIYEKEIKLEENIEKMKIKDYFKKSIKCIFEPIDNII